MICHYLKKNIYFFSLKHRGYWLDKQVWQIVKDQDSHQIEPSEYKFKFDEMLIQAERSVCFGVKRSTGECKGYHLYGVRKYSIAVILLTAILNKTMKQTIEGQGKTPSMFSKKTSAQPKNPSDIRGFFTIWRPVTTLSNNILLFYTLGVLH